MNIATGISAVAELEVSELHYPSLGTSYAYKTYKLLNLSCSKMGSAKNKKNPHVSRGNSGNADHYSAATENTSKRRISVLAVTQIPWKEAESSIYNS